MRAKHSVVGFMDFPIGRPLTMPPIDEAGGETGEPRLDSEKTGAKASHLGGWYEVGVRRWVSQRLIPPAAYRI